MSHLNFYGLNQEPFSNAPVSRFYFNSDQHARALVRLNHVVSNMKGLALLVGDIGAGKTTLARRMLDSLPEKEFEAALLVIIHSGITAGWLLKRIAVQLGVGKPADDKLTLLSQLYRRLLQINQEGRKAVVLIDEAQMLKSREIMEEFRGLLNLEIPERKLITFVFFGLPEIEENLKLDPPLMQRVAMRCRLDALSLDSAHKYIEHRLRLAGAQTPIFAPDAVVAVHRYSMGVPRVMNTLCDNALFEGFIMKRQTIGGNIIETIASDLALDRFVPTAALNQDYSRGHGQRQRSAGTDPILATYGEQQPAAQVDMEQTQFEPVNEDLAAGEVWRAHQNHPPAPPVPSPTPAVQPSPEPPAVPPSPAPEATDEIEIRLDADVDVQAQPHAQNHDEEAADSVEEEYEEVFERLSTEDMEDINALLDGLEEKV